MKMTYISRIQGNMKGYKTIYTTRATSRIIDGSYNSIYKGRSMNFDELREYVVGDDIKDMDWKASARSQKLLVRQYIAEKKHNIMLVMDAGKRMLGYANDVQEKSDVALMAAGTLAYMVCDNGDYVSATYVSDRDVTMTNDSDTGDALSFIARNFRRRMIILVVTDTRGILNMSEATVKQLKVLHDILLINVEDAGMNGKNVYDLSGDTYIPEFFTRDMKLAKKEERKRQELSSACDDKLKKLGISYLTVRSSDSMDEKIVELLNKHKTESSGK